MRYDFSRGFCCDESKKAGSARFSGGTGYSSLTRSSRGPVNPLLIPDSGSMDDGPVWKVASRKNRNKVKSPKTFEFPMTSEGLTSDQLLSGTGTLLRHGPTVNQEVHEPEFEPYNFCEMEPTDLVGNRSDGVPTEPLNLVLEVPAATEITNSSCIDGDSSRVFKDPTKTCCFDGDRNLQAMPDEDLRPEHEIPVETMAISCPSATDQIGTADPCRESLVAGFLPVVVLEPDMGNFVPVLETPNAGGADACNAMPTVVTSPEAATNSASKQSPTGSQPVTGLSLPTDPILPQTTNSIIPFPKKSQSLTNPRPLISPSTEVIDLQVEDPLVEDSDKAGESSDEYELAIPPGFTPSHEDNAEDGEILEFFKEKFKSPKPSNGDMNYSTFHNLHRSPRIRRKPA